jgi:hypothetical protein
MQLLAPVTAHGGALAPLPLFAPRFAASRQICPLRAQPRGYLALRDLIQATPEWSSAYACETAVSCARH